MQENLYNKYKGTTLQFIKADICYCKFQGNKRDWSTLMISPHHILVWLHVYPDVITCLQIVSSALLVQSQC